MRVTVRLPDDLGQEVKRRTDNVSAYVAEALSEKLQADRRQEALHRISTAIGSFEVSSKAYKTLQKERRNSDRA